MVFEYYHTVQYYETDQMQVVHHSNYIRWFEEARTALLAEMGVNYAELEQGGIIVPVVDVSCQYKKMTRFGETVKIESKIESYNGVVMKFSYTVKSKETDEVKVVGSSSHCFLDKEHNILILKKQKPDIDNKIKKGCSTT